MCRGPWESSDIDRVLDDIGWTVEAKRSLGARLGTEFGTATGDVRFTKEGRVQIISGAVCPYIHRDLPDAWAWRQDVFADVVAAATTALGEPTDRRPGESPEVRWRGPHATVGVRSSSVLVRIFLATNEHLDDEWWEGQEL